MFLPQEKIKLAKKMPAYAVFTDDFHYSDKWAVLLLKCWISARQDLQSGLIQASEFQKSLRNAIPDIADWRSCFKDAANEIGADKNDNELLYAYIIENLERAFDLIPNNLHTDLVWVPGWDYKQDIGDCLTELGLSSTRWKSPYIADISPGEWLKNLLLLVNQSSDAVISAAIENNGEDGAMFAKRCQDASFSVNLDASRPSLMTGNQVIDLIENSYYKAIPVFHCEVNLRALFACDPTKPIKMSTPKGQVHIGLHEPLVGAGYMDSYIGEIVIPSEATGFAAGLEWENSIDNVYGIKKASFNTKPVQD